MDDERKGIGVHQMNELSKQIVDLLRNAYLGATVYQDSDTMIRISRAVAAFEADPQLEITEQPHKFYQICRACTDRFPRLRRV